MIHDLAVISPSAFVHEDVSIGPYSIVGDDVEIGSGSRIESHVVLKGPCIIGRDNHIFQFASIGDDPQDKKYGGEPTRLVIGDRNTIREYCTINRGTVQDREETSVGNDNWIMSYVHIAHDCVIGNNTIFANNTTLGGHVKIDDWAILGGFTAVHQFCHIGKHAFTGIFTAVTKDVPAYVLASGSPAVPRGINTEGLKRRGFTANQISNIREAYRILYRQDLKLENAVKKLEKSAKTQEELLVLLESVRASSRGIIR
ncbi:MAG: acyl-ACP--UDP-N-acetylglucosamine O-acyltransferase [Gammaproteobacteria bacterium]|nr:acyl-ACP--UDP-N-acetylglucosamine O-acyltransferase [Gammaproteobacteria bacterium]